MEQRLVEPTRGSEVDILDGGLAVTQPGDAQAGLEALGVAAGRFAVEQQRQPFGVGEITAFLLRFEFEEGLRHAVELERSELIECGMDEHRSSSPN